MHAFFSFNFALREYFFGTSPPPHKFSNGPSLMVLNENSNEHEYINHQLTGLSRKASLYPPIRETMAHKKALEILSSIG